jgi:hypothetical protein
VFERNVWPPSSGQTEEADSEHLSLAYNIVYNVESQPMFLENISPPSTELKGKPNNKTS